MRCFLSMTFFLLVVPSMLFANGGPIDGSDVKATGNIRMIQNKDISLDTEELRVVLEADNAIVRAEYHLTNHGKKETVTYGFPVDCIRPEDREFFEDPKKAGKPLQNVVIEADGKALKSREYKEPKKKGKKVKQLPYLRTWTVVDLEFEEAEQKVVTVSYRVKNLFDDWSYTKSFKPEYSDRTFTYLLSPSGSWGDGIVRRLAITIDISKIKSKAGVIKKIAPHGYTISDDVIRWELADFDIKKAKDLKVVYDDSARLMSEFVVAEQMPARLVKQAKGSTTLKDPVDPGRHDPSRTLDRNLDTAWCEGATGDGIGQSLTFELKDVIVSGVGIINGYVKNEETFQSNNRIKKIKLIMVQKNGENKEEIVDLPRRDVHRLNREAVAPFIDWVLDNGDPYETTKSITLVIQEVYPGSRYRDTCISEVYLLGSSAMERGTNQ